MRILLLGDASNYHKCLSIGLVRAGHEVTVASNGSLWMGTSRDIDLSRRSGKLGGALLWAKLNTILSSRLKGYDVVQIHNPIFVDLRPHRVKQLFDKLRRDNGGVFLTALGTDPQYIDMCKSSDCPIKYNEFAIGTRPTNYSLNQADFIASWQYKPLVDYSKYVYDNIDGVVSALYEYQLSCLRQLPEDMVAYGGIPVDTRAVEFEQLPTDIKTVRVMLACHKDRETEKGIDILLPLLRELEAKNPGRMNLDFVQNVPFVQFQDTLRRAHIVVDQLYSYTPATTALMAMAAGKAVVSGGEGDYYRFIGEDTLRPIINPNPSDLNAFKRQMQEIIDNPQCLSARSKAGREFVTKHNDVDVVAKRFIEFWERRLR